MSAIVCRATDAGACLPVPSLTGASLGLPATASRVITLHDVLPASLTAGPARLLTYRVELSNTQGRSGGFGDAAYASAGAAPAPVASLSAQGSRQGVVVRWAASPPNATADGEVVLRREQTSAAPPDASKPKHAAPNVLWLGTGPLADPLEQSAPPQPKANADAHGVLDASAAVNTTYLYAAERQRTVRLTGHDLVLHSLLSAPVEVELRAIYPPPPPTDLVGTAFPLAPSTETGAPADVAVDLIWTPADDSGTSGYLVTREPLDRNGSPSGAPATLTPQPVRIPSFHDILPAALATQGRVRYTVRAVDAAGLQSSPATATVETGARSN